MDDKLLSLNSNLSFVVERGLSRIRRSAHIGGIGAICYDRFRADKDRDARIDTLYIAMVKLNQGMSCIQGTAHSHSTNPARGLAVV